MPKVSVVIPTWNRAAIIDAAIASVLDQTFSDFELLVVDDGSTDKTEQVVAAFTDARVKYIRRTNGGVSAARNTGIERAAGEYIAFLDSDDLFLPQRLAVQMAVLASDPEVDLLCGRYYGCAEGMDEKKLSGTCHPPLNVRRLLLGPWMHWSTVIVKRTWFERVGGFDENFAVGEEWDMGLRLALAGCRMDCVSDPVAVVRQQSGSLAKDLHRHAPTLMAVLDKAFADPRMPAELRPLHKRARAIQYMIMAASAYLAHDFEGGSTLLASALQTDEALAKEELDFLANRIINHVNGLAADDPKTILRQIVANLPGDKALANRLAHHFWAEFHTRTAFDAYRAGNPRDCANAVLQAITNQPSRLRNRGLLSIFVRSLFGHRSVAEMS